MTEAPTPEVKPGWRTTEFWMSAPAIVIGLLAASGAISPEKAEPISQAVTQIAGGIISGMAALGYSLSRGNAKKGKKK